MPPKYLLENEAGDTLTESVAIQSRGVMITCAGDFDSITFEDRVFGIEWCPVLDVKTEEPITITAPTNELALITQVNCGYQLRATVIGGTDVTIAINEGT